MNLIIKAWIICIDENEGNNNYLPKTKPKIFEKQRISCFDDNVNMMAKDIEDEDMVRFESTPK